MKADIKDNTDIPAQALTPALQQYFVNKAAHPDCLLFYRMGDFYEIFFDDAVKASAILGITLTKRGKHNGHDIPMCGVPVHSSEGYLHSLIESGCRVAICEQMESAEEVKKRGHKAVMRREVVRVVTPGTITEDTLLDARRSNYLCALACARGEWSLAWLELSTGEFRYCNPTRAMLAAELARVAPHEILLADSAQAELGTQEFWQEWRDRATVQPEVWFDAQKGERRLKEYFHVAALDSLSDFSAADMAACGALIEYISLTQKASLPRLDTPVRHGVNAVLAIDPATRRNLELTVTMSGERKGSLLSVIDKTITGGGARLLASCLTAPLTDPVAINSRLDGVAFFVNDANKRRTLREAFLQCPDLERAVSRVCLDRGGPRDLLAIKAGLETCVRVRGNLEQEKELPDALHAHLSALGQHDEVMGTLREALKQEAPLLARDGNFVADGHHAALDEFRTLRDESKRLIAALEARYQKETDIATLKIRYNNVLGYYAEITLQHQKKITENFIHRQSLANNLRYTTTELGELERKIAEAGDRALKLELEIFAQLVELVKAKAGDITKAARALAALDVAAALAELASEKRYTRPKVDSSLAFDIRGGRHAVVEDMLGKSGQGSFISNNCNLQEAQRLWLLTGPNMAGKSTFLRQNALIALLAQIGSFVPADAAHIGVVDRLFSRVGAADDLRAGAPPSWWKWSKRRRS